MWYLIKSGIFGSTSKSWNTLSNKKATVNTRAPNAVIINHDVVFNQIINRSPKWQVLPVETLRVHQKGRQPSLLTWNTSYPIDIIDFLQGKGTSLPLRFSILHTRVSLLIRQIGTFLQHPLKAWRKTAAFQCIQFKTSEGRKWTTT